MVEKEIDRVKETEKRKILFRGKCKANNLWYYGFLYKDCFILDGEEEYDYGGYSDGVDETWIDTMMYCVDKNTVGQFTGLYDINGREIFEGDIIHLKDFNLKDTSKNNHNYQIEYKHGYFAATKKGQGRVRIYDGVMWAAGGEVIGNIHDNPELLEVA